ncbi:gliding motility-associated-like protein [Arcicella aurantiaca]|uniref:Gliding motility-associated-like protein n=1 Tax=Arcicella aurantiaca TaxID=591202 RepID=A0A316EB20_9BACT|nr:gliding motility-associated C-terminal domain-containing protein [Arcicella aurantiaca]PWK27327.1 gliding motility-associated-like protein [Arcicella aurantiaca]
MNRHSFVKLFCRKSFLLLFLYALLHVCISTHAQTTPPSILWKKTLGGTLNETLNSTYETTDGGYILGGQTSSSDGDVQGSRKGLLDAWVVKINATGTIEWQKDFGGSRDDVVTSVKETSDQGFIVEGYTASTDGDFSTNHGGTDIFVIKLSKTGFVEWTKCFGGTLDEKSGEIVVSSEGGYLFTGSAKSFNGDLTGQSPSDADAWVMKISSTGTIQWQRLFNGPYTDICKAAKQLPDKNYVLVNNTGTVAGTNQREDIFVSIVKPNGNVSSQASYGGSRQEFASCLELTPDGGFVILGKTNSNNGSVTQNQGDFDVWILKMNASASLQWKKTFGGSRVDGGVSTEAWGSIHATDDDGYIFTSSTNSTDGDVAIPTTAWSGSQARVWVVKLNCKQNIQWQQVLGGNAGDYGIFAKQNSDRSYFITANATSNDGDVTGNKGSRDFWLIKTNPEPKLKPNLAVSGSIPFCEGNSIKLNGDLGPLYNYQWQKDDVDILGETSTRLTVSQSGTYKIVAKSKDCPKPQADTSIIVVVTPKPVLVLPKDTTFCTTPMKLIVGTTTPVSGATYAWSSGETTSAITPTANGKYEVTVSAGGCVVKTASNVKKGTLPLVNLPTQIEDCFDVSTPYILSAGTDATWKYRWLPNNETSNNINISQAGTYKVKVTNADNCSVEKTVQMILKCVSKIYAPNIFTPNADGNNDAFLIVAQDVTDFELKIYDRWGELVFMTISQTDGWDGVYRGQNAPEGTYTWQMKYKNSNQPFEILTKSGTVMLTR